MLNLIHQHRLTKLLLNCTYYEEILVINFLKVYIFFLLVNSLKNQEASDSESETSSGSFIFMGGGKPKKWYVNRRQFASNEPY